MTLILHLLKTDLRRFCVLIATWVVLWIASTTLDIARPITTANPRLVVALGTAAALVWVAALLLDVILVSLVVHAHPLVGSDAFWMTRPIPPVTLMLSKIVLLSALFLVARTLGDIAIMAIYDLPAGWIAKVAAETILTRAMWLLALMTGAVVTRTLAGVGLIWGAALLSLALFLVIAGLIVSSRMEAEGVGAVGGGFASQSIGLGNENGGGPIAGLVFQLLTIAAGLALLVVQYRVRLRRYSVVAGVAGLLVAYAMSTYVPWPDLHAEPALPEWATAPGALNPAADPASVTFDAERGWIGLERQWRMGRAAVSLGTVPAGCLPNLRVERATVALGGGPRLESGKLEYGQPAILDANEPAQERKVLRDVLGVARLLDFNPPGSPPILPMIVALRESDFVAQTGKAGSYSGVFEVTLTRYEIAATLPLHRRALFQDGSYRFLIEEVRHSGGLALRVRTSSANSWLDSSPPRPRAYYLRNRRRGEAVVLMSRSLLQSWVPLGMTSGSAEAVGSGFGVDASVLTLPPSLPIDESWTADAELVIVRTTEGASVSRSLELPRIELRATAPRQ